MEEPVLFGSFLLATLFFTCGNSMYGSSEDFCQTETFRASCDPGEVILMTVANYGRMHHGRCVKKDYGFIGCSTSVLRMADMKCSGRQKCSLGIPDKDFDLTEPCPDDLKTFFQGGYVCMKVATASKDLCQTSGYVKLIATHGYLSSLTAQTSGCGTPTTPWILEAKAGQRINITLHDFTSATVGGAISMAYGLRLEDNSWASCRQLAIIKEDKREERVSNCIAKSRETLVYTSVSNSVQVHILPSGVDESQFLLEYTVTGCEDPPQPKHGWIRRYGFKAEVGCDTDKQQIWHLRCHDNKWKGAKINCTPLPTRPHKNNWGTFYLPDELSIVLVIVIALFIGVIILAVGLIYLKRRAARQRSMIPAEEMVYSPGMRGTSLPLPTKKEHRVITVPHDPRSILKYDENEYALIWEVQNGPPDVDDSTKTGSGVTHTGSTFGPGPVSRSDTGSTHTYQSASCILNDHPRESPKYFELDPQAKCDK